MDSRLAAEAGHQGGAAGRRERKDSAAALAAAPSQQRPAGFGSHVGHSGFPAFPAPDVDHPRAKVNVVPIQGQRLAAGEAAVDQRQHQGTVAGSAHAQDLSHVLAAEHLHALLFHPGHPHSHRLINPALFMRKPEEGPHRPRVRVDCGGRDAALRDGRQEGSAERLESS